jgi:N-methylhydantoinase A
VEAVTFRVSALGPPGSVRTSSPASGTAQPIDRRKVADVQAPVYARADLSLGARLDGPAVVVELDSTTWLDENSVATVHPSGALIVEAGAE